MMRSMKIWGTSLVLSVSIWMGAVAAEKPNVVVFLADDMGYGDMGAYGHKVIQTPELDKLAKEGVLYTDCHSAATVCSPSRAGILTGRQPRRVGVNGWIPSGSNMHLREEEITLPEILQKNGYVTCLVGKYHSNGKFNSDEQPQPGDQGFDYWFATQNNADPTHEDPENFVRNGEEVGKIEGYSSTIIADEALTWLKTVEPGKPYALFVWFHAPHEPIETSKPFLALYKGIEHPERATYYGNISEMDHNIGRILKAVEKRGETNNTFVFFTSDNGPTDWYRKSYGEAGPLRGMKGEVWEGGHRVPGVIRWPGHAKAGTVSEELVNGTDLLPTVCDMIGVPIPKDRVIDGASIVPTFTGGKVERKIPAYWEKHWKEGPHVAMRDGDFKIMATYGDNWSLKNFILYNLKDDLAEKNEISTQHPKKFAEMKKRLVALNQEIHDEGPVWEETSVAKDGYERAKASSTRFKKRLPVLAIDGDKETRWASKVGEKTQWIEVEMEEIKERDTIEIRWEKAAASEYIVSVSPDGKNYNEVAHIEDGKSGEFREINFAKQPVRSIRIDCLKRTSDWGYSIYEINVW